jgi:hypothetical protein
MANSGIIVYNENDKLVLDNTYKNFYVSREITLSGSGTVSGSFADGEYLAAVGGLTGTTLDAYCENTPGGYSCTVKTYQAGMKIYILSTNIPKTSAGVGLQIFNTNGKKIFDSAVEPAKIIAFGHEEQGLPTDGNYTYAIASGSPVTEKSMDIYYDVQKSHSTKYYPEKTHTVNHVEVWHNEQKYVAETYHYEYVKQSDGSYKMTKIIDTPAHYETVKVVDQKAYTETVVDQEAYTEYTTSWSVMRYAIEKIKKSNFEINGGRISLQQTGYDENKDAAIQISSGSETSKITYPAGAKAPANYTEDYYFTINPTSFLLLDVTGV